MKVYDKAAWHIDGGEQEEGVISRFKEILEFLRDQKMLNADGLESMEYCMDGGISLNSMMVSDEGKDFLDCYYDQILKQNPAELKENLCQAFKEYCDKRSN